MAHRSVVHGRVLGAGVAMLALAGLVLAGCSSSKSSTGTTQATSGSNTSSSGGTGSTSSQIQALTSSVQASEHTTYKAVYTLTSSGSSGPQTITLEQKPPESLLSTSAGLVIDNGTTTYFCSKSGANTSCFSAGGGVNPLASIATLFNPTSAVTAMQAAESEVEAHVAGYNVSFSSATFAGQSASCVTVTSQTQIAKYCVTKKTGILAYSGTAANSFGLSSFSTSVAASDFALPAGAQTVTLPSGAG